MIEWRKRLTSASSVLAWEANLSDCASLAREWKGDRMKGEVDGERLMIASSVLVWVANLSNRASLAREWKVI